MSRREFIRNAALSTTLAPAALHTVASEARAQKAKKEEKPIVIDCHVHMLRLNPGPNSPRGSMVNHNSFHEYNGDLWVAEADRAGVDIGLVKSYSTQDLSYVTKVSLDTTEEYQMEACKKYPTRLYWMDIFNPKDDDMNQWKEKIKNPLLHGLAFYPTNFYPSGHGLDHRFYIDLLEMAVEQKKGKALISFEQTPPAENATRMKQWVALVRHFGSNVHWCVMHGSEGRRGQPGRGMLDRVPMVAAIQDLNGQYNNIWLETAGAREEYPYIAWQERIHGLMEDVGYDKVGIGSDWPGSDTTAKYFQLFDAFRNHADWMAVRDKRWFLGENAARFMVLPEAKPLT